MAGGSQGFGQGVVSRVADAVRGANPQNAPSNVGAVFNQATPNVYAPSYSNPFSAGFTGVADYNPAAQNVPRIFAGEAQRPGQANFQLTDAQRANLLSQQAPQPVMAPRAPIQQMPIGPAQQIQQAGLQALMANMMAQYQNVPGALAMTQRPQMMAPRFSAPALAYRPNIQAVQQNLARVKPSVYKTDLDAARERIAELEGSQQQRGSE